MAIALGSVIGSNQSKAVGTTLAVTATPSPLPAVGELVVCYCARDSTSTSGDTGGDTLSDALGNTYTSYYSYSSHFVIVHFYSVLTAAWTGSTTVTWTHPSITSRAMRLHHFTGSGFTASASNAVLSANVATGLPTATFTAVPNGALIACSCVIEGPNGTVATGDSDTVNGSWSTIAQLGTTGGSAGSNITSAVQYKIVTALGDQTWNINTNQAVDSMEMLTVFYEVVAVAQFGSRYVYRPANRRAANW